MNTSIPSVVPTAQRTLSPKMRFLYRFFNIFSQVMGALLVFYTYLHDPTRAFFFLGTSLLFITDTVLYLTTGIVYDTSIISLTKRKIFLPPTNQTNQLEGRDKTIAVGIIFFGFFGSLLISFLLFVLQYIR